MNEGGQLGKPKERWEGGKEKKGKGWNSILGGRKQLNILGKSFYYRIECIYTEGNTFKISFWDCLAGIAMVLNGVKKVDLEGGDRGF